MPSLQNRRTWRPDVGIGANRVSRTRLLVALLLLVVMVQLFPQNAGVIKLVWVCTVGLIALAWMGRRYLIRYQLRRAQAAQAAADDSEYRQYREELDIIRDQYDPQRDLDDPTSIAPEYRDALNALHDKHHAMLERRFGPR